jgi:hypothetical protein
MIIDGIGGIRRTRGREIARLEVAGLQLESHVWHFIVTLILASRSILYNQAIQVSMYSTRNMSSPFTSYQEIPIHHLTKST